MTDNDQVEALLYSAAEIVDWPEPSPHLVTRVIGQLEPPTARPAPGAVRFRLALAATIVIILAGAILAIPGARQAVADLFEAAGFRLGITSDPIPDVGGNLDLGEAVELAEAVQQVEFVIRQPIGPIPGPPDRVYISDQNRVSMVWGGYEALPAAQDSDVALLLTQYETRQQPVIGSKQLGPGTSVEDVQVEGAQGLWIEGAPHTITLFDDEGNFSEESTRLAANVLLWTIEGINYRLETTGNLATALSVINALGPPDRPEPRDGSAR